MKEFNLEKRRWVLSGVAILIVAIYLVRLFTLQIMSDDYRKSADSNAFLKKIEFPSRGLITDRHGELLVYNQPSYDIMVVMNEEQGRLDTTEFCNTLHITREEFDRRMASIKDRSKNPGYSRFTQQLFMSQLSDVEFSAFQEKMYRFPGFYIQRRSIRAYKYPIAAQLLGDVAEVSPSDIEDDEYYMAGDYIGKLGIERSYEKQLRGQKGVQILLRDAHGRIQGSYQNGQYDQQPKAGSDLTLGLDKGMQELGERLMEGKLGAIVAIEPSTGEILCMVSSPTYDPNTMLGKTRGKAQHEMTLDPAMPLLNRAIMGQYPPGSTFKTSQAVTLLTEGIINDSTRYSCNHGFNFKGLHLGCHGHGSPLSIVPALSTSCNGFFCWGLYYMLNNRTKYQSQTQAMDTWRDYMVSMGFGYKLGIDLPGEKRGMIPNAQFYDNAFGKWNPLSIISISIGQGEVNLTPLQIANLGATIANRGYYITPHVVKDVKGQKLDPKYTEKHYTRGSRAAYEEVVRGMVASATGGTCHAAFRAGYTLAGKTGTAENRGKDHSVFMGFAPVDTPKVAIAVYVENGGFGATFGVPIGSLLMEQYINGHLTSADSARAVAIQARHIDYPFDRPMSHADSLRLDSIKRINALKDSIKREETEKIKKEREQQAAQQATEDDGEHHDKQQLPDQPAVKPEEETKLHPEPDKDDDKPKPKDDKGKSKDDKGKSKREPSENKSD